MNGGMADIIAAHWARELPSLEGRMFALRCQAEGCTWGGERDYIDHSTHVAGILIAAGYGDVREAAASALRAAAVEAHARGDIGKDSPYAVSVTAFLKGRADKALEVSA